MELIILSGLPGSGKTTYANSLDGVQVVSRDNWRELERQRLNTTEYFPHGSAAKEYVHWADYLASVINTGFYKAVCIDQTTLTINAAIKLLNAICVRCPDAWNNDLQVKFVVLTTPIHICMARNDQRIGKARVPDETMMGMIRSFNIHAGDMRRKFDAQPLLRGLKFDIKFIRSPEGE